jgi:thioredoxin reductase
LITIICTSSFVNCTSFNNNLKTLKVTIITKSVQVMGGNKLYDVIIIGGGPAGLSAALILGRCLRSAIVFDSGKPRNLKSKELHGFLSRDGINPMELLRISKEQLHQYKIDFNSMEVTRAQSKPDGTFEVEDQNGNTYYSKKLLIATGIVDDVPDIDGIEKFYGSSVFHCPYCDAFEVRLKPLAVYGKGKSGVGLALSLVNWSDDVILCTDGREVTSEERDLLKLKDIKIIANKIDRLEGQGGLLKRIVFSDGSFLERNALFFTTKQYQSSNIADQLGCRFTEKGIVKVGKFQNTSVPGVFVAGDAARDMQLAMIAAADGAKAAVIINKTLQKEERSLKNIDRLIEH